MTTDCNNWWTLHLPEYFHWTNYTNFLILLVFYHFLLVQYYWTKLGVGSSKSNFGDDLFDVDGESVHEEVYFILK